MHRGSQPTPSLLAGSALPQKHKRIFKYSKSLKNASFMGRAYGQSSQQRSLFKVKELNEEAQSDGTSRKDLKSILQPYLDEQFCLSDYQDKLMGLFPTVESINSLFSNNPQQMIEENVQMSCLERYLGLIRFLGSGEGHFRFSVNDQQCLLARLSTERQKTSSCPEVMRVSQQQGEMAVARANFMEKLKTNESKYDASLGRMSEASRELAFAYRVYLQSVTQLRSTLQKIQNPVPNNFLPIQEYTRLLITKTFSKAFQHSQMEPLTYFQSREHIEKQKEEAFASEVSMQSFSDYMQRRRKKRGRRVVLPTACSICLSDHWQLSNTFHHCNHCGLRAHRLCFSFTERCGNCAYRKVQRMLKLKVPCCIICRQTGLLPIKFDEKTYAHGFCLLFHGSWGLISVHCQEGKSSGSLGRSSQTFYNGKIQFVKPGHNRLVQQSRQEQEIVENHMPDYELMHQEHCLGGIGIQRNEDCWQEQTQQVRNCTKCGQSCMEDYFVSCDRCGRQYHALCAFLKGASFEMENSNSREDFSKRTRIDCCSESAMEQSFNRRFRLNYLREAQLYNPKASQESHSHSYLN